MRGNLQSLERSARMIRLSLENEGYFIHPYKKGVYKIPYPNNNFSFLIEGDEDLSVDDSDTLNRNLDKILIDKVEESIYFFRYLGYNYDDAIKYIRFLSDSMLGEYKFRVEVRPPLKDNSKQILTGVDLYFEGKDFPEIKTNDWSSWDEKWEDIGDGKFYLATVYFSADYDFE